MSDDQFLSQFGNTLDERGAQRLESNVSLTQRWEKWNFFGRLFFYQDLTTDQPVELQRLPELRLNAFQQPLPWVPGLLFEMDSSYNNFVREIGAAGQRLNVAPRISYPVSPGGLFTITPRVGFRETIYDTRVVGTKEDHGFVVEDTVKELTVRSLFEAGVDLDARAQRVFDLDGAYGIQKLQHLIEPRVNYNFLDGDDPHDLPQYDGIDTIAPGHTVTYSLTNRLKARAVGQDDAPGRVWEVIRFTLSQTYTIDPSDDADHDHRCGRRRGWLRKPSRPRRSREHHPSGSRTSGGPHPRAALGHPLPGDGVLRPLRVQRQRGHHRPLLRGGALAGLVRHPPRGERAARVHPGSRRGPDRQPLDRSVHK